MADEMTGETIGDAAPPACTFERPVQPDGTTVFDADGRLVACAKSPATAEYLAWVINSHDEVSELQRRIEKQFAARLPKATPGG